MTLLNSSLPSASDQSDSGSAADKQQFLQYLFLIGLTLLYLIFELGFNARLLDVVGGNADSNDVLHIERYGRTLSGIAAALITLQVLLAVRNKNNHNKPSFQAIAVYFLITVFVVFFTINKFVDYIVDSRDAEFRRLAVHTVLLQKSLVKGQLELTGLVEDKTLYSRPEGKAFLALFPLLAVSVDRLEEKTSAVKESLIRAEIIRTKPIKAYHEDYRKAIKELNVKWDQYSAIKSPSENELLSLQDQSWNDYTRRLARRGWTPSTVPTYARKSVIKNVRRKVPVPKDWDPSDEATFRAAVEARYRQKFLPKTRNGKTDRNYIPPGLSYKEFVAQTNAQQELRKNLKLPSRIRIASSYETEEEFRPIYNAFINNQLQGELEKFDSQIKDFAKGSKFEKEGLDATRAAVVPTIALFFSLLGAIGHFSKLLFLLTKTTAKACKIRWLYRIAIIVPLATLIIVWTSLSNMNNVVTQSPLFTQMQEWMSNGDGINNTSASVRRHVITNLTHVIAVGQGYSYPLNETIREIILRGLSYGYHGDGR